MALPPKPGRIIKRCPTTKRWYAVEPNLTMLKCYPLPPHSKKEIKELRESGQSMMRILYVRSTYDEAVKRYKQLIAHGWSPKRIEFVYAQREEFDAFKQGEVLLIPLEESEVEPTTE